MGAREVEVANRFLSAVEAAVKARDGNPGSVYPLLADDVEWVNPRRTLRGIDAIRAREIWDFPPEHLDVEFEPAEWQDLGEGRLSSEVREVFLWSVTREFVRERRLRIELSIRDDRIRRVEVQPAGDDT
jgi:hypothetical protein